MRLWRAVIALFARDATPVILYPPSGELIPCSSATFSWSGGSAPYTLMYSFAGGNTNTWGVSSGTQILFCPPYIGADTPVHFTLVDGSGGQAGLDMILRGTMSVCGTVNQSCIPNSSGGTTTTRASTATTRFSSSSASVTRTTTTRASTAPPTSTRTQTQTTAPTTPPTTTTRGTGPTVSTTPDQGTTETSITTKPTDVNNPTQPGGPTSHTPGSPSDTNEQNPTGTGDTGQGPNQTGTDGGTGANTSEGGAPTQGPHSGSDNPTQTVGPLRNTQSDERPAAKMSKQAIGAIIGTMVSAALLFLAFLVFRWRRRHKRKHDPHPILPRSASNESTGNIMTQPPVPPAVTVQTLDLQTEMTDTSPITPRSMDPLTPSSRRIPNSKQRSLFPYASRLSDDGTESIPPSVVDTGTAPLSESIVLDVSDVSQEHEADANGGLHPPGNPVQPSSPVSLQHLINRELENLLTDPDTQSYWNSLNSPPSPSYDPSSYGLGAQSGPTLASTSKVPYGPPVTRQNTSSHYTTDRTSLAPPSPSSAGSHQLRLSRQDMDVLADLVAARITRGQRPGQLQPRLQPHQEQQLEGGPGPPPSYA